MMKKYKKAMSAGQLRVFTLGQVELADKIESVSFYLTGFNDDGLPGWSTDLRKASQYTALGKAIADAQRITSVRACVGLQNQTEYPTWDRCVWFPGMALTHLSPQWYAEHADVILTLPEGDDKDYAIVCAARHLSRRNA